MYVIDEQQKLSTSYTSAQSDERFLSYTLQYLLILYADNEGPDQTVLILYPICFHY